MMQVQVDIDDYIDGSEELIVRVEGVVGGSMDRFEGRVVRVDVHLSQLRQADHRDMCCRMEAYASALKPIAVSHEALTLSEAIHAASAKLERAVLAALGRGKPKAAVSGKRAGGAGEGLGPLQSW